MATTLDDDPWGPGQEPLEYGALVARFEKICEDAGRTPYSLVPRSIMRGIAAGLSRAPSIRRTDPLKSHQQRSLWARLADEATARPEHVGFVLLGDGGNRELAERLGVPHKTLATHLDTWRRTRPRMVVTFTGRRTRGTVPLHAVQLPVASDLVLWSATTRATVDEVDARPPHPLLVADAAERLAMLGTTGPTFGAWPDLDDAVSDLGAAITRKGGEAPRRRLETGRHR
ncbi:MAG: hypothetical protein P8M16_07190 [Acidimicrobiales bacterium]|nr:hypothetical protein [Acidimicrobiales bacterium]